MLKTLLLLVLNGSVLIYADNYQVPSYRYLEYHPLQEIDDYFHQRYIDYWNQSVNLDKNLGFFLSVIEKEDFNTIGYHGCSMDFRIFQDIVKAVFEEKLGYEDIPKNFHFVRVPGDNDFDLPNGKGSFVDKFGRNTQKLSEAKKKLIINDLITSPFQKVFNFYPEQISFNENESHILWEYILKFANYLDLTDKIGATQELFAKSFTPTILQKKPVDICAYTEIMLEHNPYKKTILKSIWRNKNDCAPNLLIKAEPLPFFDYIEHIEPISQLFYNICAYNDYKIDYNQIYSFFSNHLSSEGILRSFWKTKHDYPYGYVTFSFLMPFCDVEAKQQKLLICLNIPFFGNYFRGDESTLGIFSRNMSIESGDAVVESIIDSFFDEIGLSELSADELFETARQHIDKTNIYEGCILHFSDNSQNRYITNGSCYTSRPFGYPIPLIMPTDIIDGKTHFQDPRGGDYQIRLIACNNTTLNPYSGFSVLRYDLLPEQTALDIDNDIRQKIKNASIDPTKRDLYINKINLIWHQNPANH